MTPMDPEERVLAALRDRTNRVGAAAQRTRPADFQREQPPPGLWDGIAAELDIESGSPHPETEPELAEVVSISGWRRAARPLLVAAAIILVVGVAITAVISSGDDASTTVLASTQLEPLGEAGSGSAELITNDEGELALVVDYTGLEPVDGFHEVWLLDPDVTQLISLGPARADGTYQVPAGLDPTLVPVVDVSFEVFDGDPSHGGNSVLRGVLKA